VTDTSLVPAGGEASAPPSAEAAPSRDLLVALRQLMGLLDYNVSEEALIAGLPVKGTLTREQVLRIAHVHGFEASWQTRPLANLPSLLLPCLATRTENRAAVITAMDAKHVSALLPEMGDAPAQLDRTAFEADLAGDILLLKRSGMRTATDRRSGVELLDEKGHWFWRVVRHFRGYYVEAAIAAVMVNVLALASIFFTMNVYDRVVSNQAYTTLWTLAIGVGIALAFEYLLRNLRAWLLDSAGKKADLLLGSSLFAKVLSTRLEARPQSSGAFANMLKEYESLRDFATSTVLVALSDLPFLILFLAVLWFVAGPLVLVPLLAVPLVVIVGLAAQVPMARHIGQNLREASVRHGVLIEAIESAETLKALRAEGRMQALYERASALTALTANKTRMISNLVVNFNNVVGTFTTVAMVVWGVYLIGAGELTQGALIGAVMLAGRTLNPLAALNALAVRLQQARSSYRTLTGIMKAPGDRDSEKGYSARPIRDAVLSARDLRFAYGAEAPIVVRDFATEIRRGEKVAILGRVGSGKTTLLKVLAGLYQPTAGLVMIDGVDIRQVDPAEYRKSVLYVGQHAQLFYGTLRENLKLGAPFATDEAMMRAAASVGVHAFAQQHPSGYDLMVGERGENLSGGQRQAIALARAMLVEPDVIMLDEPTSAMDTGTEQTSMRALFEYAKTRTVVLVTHRLQLLEFVDRVMVIDHGVRVTDGPKDQVMQAMQEGRVRKVDPNAALVPPRRAAPKAPPAEAPEQPAEEKNE
jgi:ATP-binding cassette subfamily C protein LapB